mgnify:CR=1 FL=1
MHSGIKKEKLEKALRYKLEIEVRKLQEENRLLKEQLQQTNVEKRGVSYFDPKNISTLTIVWFTDFGQYDILAR